MYALCAAVAVLLLICGVLLYNSVKGARRGDRIEEIARTIQDVTTPEGCRARESAYNLQLAIVQLQNDNRSIHGQPLLPLPTRPDC
jgi:hypothetical protein